MYFYIFIGWHWLTKYIGFKCTVPQHIILNCIVCTPSPVKSPSIITIFIFSVNVILQRLSPDLIHIYICVFSEGENMPCCAIIGLTGFLLLDTFIASCFSILWIALPWTFLYLKPFSSFELFPYYNSRKWVIQSKDIITFMALVIYCLIAIRKKNPKRMMALNGYCCLAPENGVKRWAQSVANADGVRVCAQDSWLLVSYL